MDGVFTSVHRERELLDLVDDSWLMDTLEDDDLDIPNQYMQEEQEEEQEEGNTLRILDLPSSIHFIHSASHIHWQILLNWPDDFLALFLFVLPFHLSISIRV